MKLSSKGSSTYKPSVAKIPSFKQWLRELQARSQKCKRYGSFLPSQEQLLKQVHHAIFHSRFRAIAFAAAPAAGKTHVIVLCASYLHDLGASTCIVTPNNELKIEFGSEMKEVDYKSRKSLPVMSIGAFIQKRSAFDYAFVDEAHNLRSAIELDENIVKSIHLEKGTPLYDDIVTRLREDKACSTRELNIETAHDILRAVRKGREKVTARHLLRTLSQWRSFCMVSGNTCDLKFLAANPERRNVLPRERLFLFSATLLDQDELSFYCNIPKEEIQTFGIGQNDFAPKKNVIYRFVRCQTAHEKKNFVISALERTRLPTLILLNNNVTCLEWEDTLSRALKDRVITIGSGLDYRKRLRAYKEFTSHPNPVLLTSSSAYWEGITIKNLRILIIPDAPFPQPTLGDSSKTAYKIQ